MNHRKFRVTGLLLIVVAFAAAAAGGEPAINLFVASHAYIVSVAPVDEESRSAENSILYQRQAGDREWRELGDCLRKVLDNGDVRFTREVEVEADGAYYYTSRPVVNGRVVSPPSAESPPQAAVIVDTLPPKAAITLPAEGASVEPGAKAAVAWTSEDENPAPLPAVLAYTTDGGKSWNRIGVELPASGTLDWIAPANLAGPAVIRLTVVDMAGNVGRDARGLDLAAKPPPAAPAVVPPQLPPVEPVHIELPPETVAPEKPSYSPNRSWLYYLMAINLMRQNKPADALQYYWLSVKEDPDFIDAWADIGLAYIDLGAYRTARDIVERTRDKAPERIDLMHLLGETYHAQGMALLTEAKTSDERQEAKGLIDKAVFWYGQALEKAAAEWRLAEQAPSFYRLGEVCYYVNFDRDGARAYWKKILELHSPTPNADLILWTAPEKRGGAKQRHQRYTYMRVSLEAWQNWARGYIEQMDARERAGILDLMPAQRITAIPTPQPLMYGGNAMNPGRDDGRSLFSLPAQLGSEAEVPICAAESGAPAGAYAPADAAMRRQSEPASNYSFYAEKPGERTRGNAPQRKTMGGGRSLFTGGPDQPPPPNPDPYAFPAMGRPAAAWNGAGPYGNEPVSNW